MRLLLISLLGLFLAGAAIVIILNIEFKGQDKTDIQVSEIMSGEVSGFNKADSVRQFSFPEDHFAHFDFRTEWWYFTGNLMTDEGRRFGYQFTIFRSGVTPGIQNDSSLFSSSSYYTVHIGISDLQNNKFYSFERNTRGMKGLAESAPGENRIYVENNELTFDFSNDATSPKLFITSSNKEFTLNFLLIPEKPVVLHGNKGLSSKSDKPGNASYYYSYTRLKTEGELKLGNESHKLKGNSWMDREWSTSALDKDQKGWDWFALQIDDGTDLMYFRLRDSQSKTLYQKGTLVKEDGSFKDLSSNDLKITLVSSVKIRGVEYPSSWKIDLVTQGTSYQVSTSMKDQTHQFRIKYYEGAVDVLKLSGTGDIKGKGYVELTGYDE